MPPQRSGSFRSRLGALLLVAPLLPLALTAWRLRHSAAAAAELKLHVVYFAHIPNATTRDWRALLSSQLGDVAEYGLLARADSFYVEISSEAPALRAAAAAHVGGILPRANVTMHTGNRFEFPGILRVWELAHASAVRDPDRHVILYFHSKGMVNSCTSIARSIWNRYLTKMVVAPFARVLRRFAHDKNVDVAGYAVSAWGFVWFNFFYARASHVRTLLPPVESEDRFYYEHWLGKHAHRDPAPPMPGFARETEPRPRGTGWFSGNALSGLSMCIDGANGTLGAHADFDGFIDDVRRGKLKISREGMQPVEMRAAGCEYVWEECK
jgi:hypothetical protein